eukprot:SAG11_NODE_808_length_7088_cov_5.136357_2_plen_225_part_00
MVLDDCQVCGPPCVQPPCVGYNTCADYAGVLNGAARIDPCGVCEPSGRYSPNCVLGCDGNYPRLDTDIDARAVLDDQCGVCGGANDCVDCAGNAITRRSVAQGIERACCDMCGTCDVLRENDCAIDCRGEYMCSNTFMAVQTDCPSASVDGPPMETCFIGGSGPPEYSSQCFSQATCDAMPRWPDTVTTHAAALASEIDTCDVRFFHAARSPLLALPPGLSCCD